ncbi:MAG: hypothetical protein ACR2FH_05150 [Caulobacteraceae bacterium]
MTPHLTASPDLYPIVLDLPGERVGFARLSEAAYRSASFLDERILAEFGPVSWAPWAEIERSAEALSPGADFIFHLGHVGSTLVSRLLGSSGRLFCLREPAILRTLAQMAWLEEARAPWPRAVFERRLEAFLRLLARVYRPGQRSLVKATSFVGEMAPLLMDRTPGGRALLMTVSPSVYLASLLGGPNSRASLPSLAAPRLARLHRRLGAAPWRIEALAEGELAAMSWACELLGPAEAANRFPARVLWLDFEAFLDDPASGLAAALTHLRGKADPGEVAAMLRSPDVGRYSKAPQYPYDAALRRQVLAQARVEHREEIGRGLAWLERAFVAWPAIDAAARAAGSF